MILEKIQEIYAKIDYIQKNKPKDAKYAYVSSSDVLSTVRKEMVERKLLLLPTIKNKAFTEIVKKEGHSSTILTELEIQYTWVDLDDKKDTLVVDWYGQGVDISGEKGVGKALTYAEKYYLLKLFNIPTNEDDPDVVANKVKKPSQQKEPSKPPKSIKLISFTKKLRDAKLTPDEMSAFCKMYNITSKDETSIDNFLNNYDFNQCLINFIKTSN